MPCPGPRPFGPARLARAGSAAVASPAVRHRLPAKSHEVFFSMFISLACYQASERPGHAAALATAGHIMRPFTPELLNVALTRASAMVQRPRGRVAACATTEGSTMTHRTVSPLALAITLVFVARPHHYWSWLGRRPAAAIISRRSPIRSSGKTAAVATSLSRRLAACRTFGLLPTGHAKIMRVQATEVRHVPLHCHRP
jgi:hypothetical protein